MSSSLLTPTVECDQTGLAPYSYNALFVNDTQTICAAGASGRCGMTNTPLSGSPHHCMGCGLGFHGSCFCGAEFDKWHTKHGAKFLPSMLPPFGQAKLADYADRLGDTRLQICHCCIDKIEAMLSVPSSSSAINVTASTNTSTDSQLPVDVDDDDEGDVVEAAVMDGDGDGDDAILLGTTAPSKAKKQKKAKKPKEPKPTYFRPSYAEVFSFVESEEFSFQRIVISPFEHNVLQSGIKTKLKGMDMGGPGRFVLAVHLNVSMLRKIATQIGITSHNVNKPEIADCIIQKVGELADKVAKALADGEDIDVSAITLVDEKGSSIVFNLPRFLNVLFSDKMIPLLANRGLNLTKDDLENKKKVDQELFTILIVEYNDISNASYGLHAFKDIPQKVDPSKFQRIPDNAWKHALEKFKNLSKEYEQHIKAWTKSGNHGRFDELSADDLKAIDPDITKCTSKYMIYMHYYMRLHHNILATCVALLPSDVARRSTQPRKLSNDNSGRSGKESGKGSESGEKEGGKYVGKASGMQVALTSIALKNNAQQKKIELDMKHSEKQTAMTASVMLSNQIKEEKQTKRRLEDELQKNCSDNRRVMNQKVRAVKAKLYSASNPQSEEIDNDDDDDLFDTEPLSQEDLIVQILDSNKKIKKWEMCYQAAEKDMEKCFLAGNNENGTENV